MEKKNKNKIPFAVFRKSAVGLAMAGMLAITPFAMAGCSGAPGDKGDKGDTGATGATGAPGSAWHFGVDTPTTATGVQGDYYYETDSGDVWYYGATGWTVISNLTGPEGADGEGVYVGYDGYIWNAKERTEYKVACATAGEYVVENTISIKDTMGKYFDGSYVDLSDNTIALMSYYMPTIGKTMYSGLSVSEMKVIAESAGDLYIGTAKVADIVEARTNGGEYNVTSEKHEVQAGVNTISLDLEVAEDETIVLGGNGSVGLYMAKGITIDDEEGNYTLVDGATHTDVVSKTDDIADTLAVQVSAYDIVYKTHIENLRNYVDSTFTLASLEAFSRTSCPYAYFNKGYHAGTKLAKIGMPVRSVDNYQEDSTFTIYVIKQSTFKNFATNPVAKYELTIPANTFTSNTVNEWYYFDVESLNINVAEDESIAFFDTNDTVLPCYNGANVVDETYHFYANDVANATSPIKKELFFDVISVYDGPVDKDAYVEALRQAEADALSQD